MVQRDHEAALQRTKDELLALASHQLRTPASGVKQYLGMLHQGYFGDLTEEQSVIANKAYIANDRQLEIIDQLLHVAKADAGQLLLRIENIDVVELVQGIIDSYTDKANEKGIKVRLKSASKKINCEVDDRYVHMIIENIMSNAIKYSYPASKINVRIESDGTDIVVEVEDYGVGIAEEDMGKLFQKFTRIENPLSRIEGGSGLGLFLADKIARAHHGEITISSSLGEGFTATLGLPRKSKLQKNVIQLTEM